MFIHPAGSGYEARSSSGCYFVAVRRSNAPRCCWCTRAIGGEVPSLGLYSTTLTPPCAESLLLYRDPRPSIQ